MKDFPRTNLRALILLWAFAESGIGGVLHALKLPFTGLLVGGIAIVCIALIAYWASNPRRAILEALFTVLLVKLAVSPHSPWQAYIAVLFQGYAGYFLFRGRNSFAIRTLVFSILCMAESALQKLLMAWLIYGTGFFKALDQAAASVLKSLGLSLDGSVVIFVFGLYFLLYIVGGFLIGRWIPLIPDQVVAFSEEVPVFALSNEETTPVHKKQRKSVLLGFVIFAFLLFALKWLAPQIPATALLYIFLRSVFVSILLLFILGPILIRWIRSWAARKAGNPVAVAAVLDQIPAYTAEAYKAVQWAANSDTGIRKIKNIVLALLVTSLRMQKDQQDG
jgi:hypothetical protein